MYVPKKKLKKVRVVSVGELFGEAIRRVTNENSLATLIYKWISLEDIEAMATKEQKEYWNQYECRFK